MSGNVNRVRAFLNSGTNINLRGNLGYIALDEAATGGYTTIVRLLLNRGVNVNAHDNTGITALMEAAGEGQLATARILLNRGANINMQSNSGKTALIYAVAGGNRAIIELLLASGANVNTRDRHGFTALTYARDENNLAVIRLLEERGATANQRNLPARVRNVIATRLVPNSARKAAKKWILGPARNVNVSTANNNAPVNLSFNKGNYGIRYTKRWISNGVNKTKSHYYTIPTFERLVGKKWSTIRHQGPTTVISAHLPHAKQIAGRVYRRNLNLVKFV